MTIVITITIHHRRHGHEKVIVSGDHDHIRVGRFPTPHYHHYHHGGYEKVIITGVHDPVLIALLMDTAVLKMRRSLRLVTMAMIIFDGQCSLQENKVNRTWCHVSQSAPQRKSCSGSRS